MSPVFFTSIWALGSYTAVFSNQSVPTPWEVVHSFFVLLTTGALLPELFASVRRVFVGFSVASIIGVAAGLLAGAFLVARQVILPANSFLRYIPPTAFIALLIVYFGVEENFKYAVVFVGVVFFIIQMVVDVVDDLDVRFVEIALSSGLSNWAIFTHVIVPVSAPRIFDVLRINLSAAWTFLVAAELIGADRGLGHFIALSQRFLRLGDLFAGILTFGLIGMITDVTLDVTSHKVFRWYYVSLRK
jgi:NitT/TauT family transport system permease protein